MKPITGRGQAVPVPGATAPNLDHAQQLVIRFFAWVDGCTKQPPERALWRQMLDFALRAAPSAAFTVYGRAMSPAIVHHIALVIQTMTDRAGITHASDREIAEQARREERVVSKAVTVLNRAFVLRTTRDSRRGAPDRRGGCTWCSASRRRPSPRPRPRIGTWSQA